MNGSCPADALCLTSLVGDPGDEVNRSADFDLIECEIGQVFRAEVVVVFVRAADEAVALVAIELHHDTLQTHIVCLDLTALLTNGVFKHARDVLERVAKRDIDVFVVLPVRHQLVVRYGQVNADSVLPALTGMAVIENDADPAAHDFGAVPRVKQDESSASIRMRVLPQRRAEEPPRCWGALSVVAVNRV
jgi:hypothetical protein